MASKGGSNVIACDLSGAPPYGFSLTGGGLSNDVTVGFLRNPVPGDPTQGYTTDKHVQFSSRAEELESVLSEGKVYYIKFPKTFSNKLSDCYGGKLTFKMEVVVPMDDNPMLLNEVDVQIQANGKKYSHRYPRAPKLYSQDEYEIKLDENSFIIDGVKTAVTETEFRSALASADSLLIRASYHSIMGDITLGDIQLQPSG